LAAGLCPDPLGRLSTPPDLLATIKEVLLLRGRRGGEGKEVKGKERERGEKKGEGEGGEKEGKGEERGKGRDVAP